MNSVLLAWVAFACTFLPLVQAQQAPIKMGAIQQEAAPVLPPADLIASDGTYDKFVLVRWAGSPESTAYKVFKATSSNATSLQEISQGWQKSTWFCDYSAQPDVDYYYAVIATDGHNNSAVSTLDKGFIRRTVPIANDTEKLLSSSEAYGAPQSAFLMVASVEKSSQNYYPGDQVNIVLNMENIFEKEVPPTDLRFYLSKDSVFDWNDVFLGNRVISNIPPDTTFQLSQSLDLPASLVMGEYQIIVVGSTQGAILSSKTYFMTINVASR